MCVGGQSWVAGSGKELLFKPGGDKAQSCDVLKPWASVGMLSAEDSRKAQITLSSEICRET